MKRLASAHLHHHFNPDKILYLTGEANYCLIHLSTGDRVLSSRTLKWYSKRWPHFMRIHKGTLVNHQCIHSCVRISTAVAYLIMTNGVQLAIGRRRIAEVKAKLRMMKEGRILSENVHSERIQAERAKEFPLVFNRNSTRF